MTEKIQQTETTTSNEAQTIPSDINKLKDNKKEKCRPMTKVVIRRLPPTMTQEQFLEQVSPLPEHDYMYFAKADMSLGQFAFSRAYINFMDQQDIFIFREKFDNYVFVDSKGTEYPAVVEFAPFQRLPKKRVGKKKDLKCGTIESDPYYVSFLENLKNQETESNTAQPKTEYSYQPSDNSNKKITTTPLLEYVKQRRQEKQRHRDEKREERRRRDLERRRTKDDPIISKVLKNPDLEKELGKDNKENKEDRISPKDIKNRSKRDDKIRDKIPRDRDTKNLTKIYRDDWNKDMKHQRRQEDRRLYGRRDERENVKEERKEIKDERRYEVREDKEAKTGKFEEKRGKSYEKMRQEKKRLAETKKQANDDLNSIGNSQREEDILAEKNVEITMSESSSERVEELNQRITSNKVEYVNSIQSESQNTGRECTVDEIKDEAEKSKSNEHLNNEATCHNESEDKKVVKRRNSLESGGEGGTGDGNYLRRHKSLDGGEQGNLQKSENEDKEKDKKDPRLERRIRNKDRPAMEIYRPGMGKFSSQVLLLGICVTEIMYTIKVLLAVVLCTTGTLSAPQRPSSGSDKDAVITSQQLEVNFDGNYINNFETSNGISHQESGQPKPVDGENPVVSQGSDSYTAPDGQQVSITYVADENGFQVQGSHIPTAPPIPPEIQRALEWNAAHPEEDDGGQRPPQRG